MYSYMNQIAFITGYSGTRPAGLERFLVELLKAMDKEPKAKSVVVYTKKGNGLKQAFARENIQNIQLFEIGFGKLWKDIGLFFAPKADIYIFNGPQVPIFFAPKKYSVIAYDFAYRQVTAETLQEKCKNKVTDYISSLAFRRAQLILTLSETIKREVHEIFHAPLKKIHPIYAGFLDVCKLHQAESLSFSFEKFFLFVSTLKERKNVFGVIQGFNHSQATHPNDSHLVIAGKYDKESRYYQSLQKYIIENNLESKVHFLGHITDNQLSWLYQNATALVSPSFVEGFGLPLLEAFLCRLPVITSRDSCQSEITGDAALLVNPYEFQEIGDAMSTLLAQPERRAILIEKGLKRAKNFSWPKTAQSLFQELEQAFHST